MTYEVFNHSALGDGAGDKRVAQPEQTDGKIGTYAKRKKNIKSVSAVRPWKPRIFNKGVWGVKAFFIRKRD